MFSSIDSENDTNNQKSKKTKNRFTEKEDNIIIEYVHKFGAHSWGRIIPYLPGRTPRQVRERYLNYLSPEVNHNEWTEEEDSLIMTLVSKIGKKWALISQSFHHRTDIAIKNRYFVLKRKEQKEIRNNLFSQLSKKSKRQLDNRLSIQLQPNLSISTGNSQSLTYNDTFENRITELNSYDKQQSTDFETNDVIEEENYNIDMLDYDNDFQINDIFNNDFDFQFLA